MNAVLKEIEDPGPRIDEARRALAQDLLALARLHDREIDRETIHGLWEVCYEDFLALRLVGAKGRDGLMLFREGLTEIPTGLCEETMDRLAADYADIYLTHALRASPCESVWLDEDNLTMQGPMFAVRDCYSRQGLAVEDWRQRTDDHLVNELRFLAYLIQSGGKSALAEAAHFMDEHPLRWIDDFAARVAQRCATHLYAGLALLTAAYLDELRDLIAQILGEPRPSAEEIEARLAAQPAESVAVEGPYLPGVAPGW
jgi:TorA maturation chaperone TorD